VLLIANVAAIYSSHVVTIFSLLHSQKIVYRNLKPENLLISPNGYLKLCILVSGKWFNGIL
jgi:serine/threonine protein kinase